MEAPSLSLGADKAGQITILDIYIIRNHSQVAPLGGEATAARHR